MKKICFIILVVVCVLTTMSGCLKKEENTIELGTSNQETNGIYNIIVDEPEKNAVTNQIKRDLIGKYSLENDKGTYFIIKENGQIEVSLNCMDGYSKYYSPDVVLHTFYSDYRTLLSFTVIRGECPFTTTNISLDFEAKDEDRKEFKSLTYLSFYDLKFVKE